MTIRHERYTTEVGRDKHCLLLGEHLILRSDCPVCRITALERERDGLLTKLERALHERDAATQECDALRGENAILLAGFDKNGCTAAERCCGDIKAGLLERAEKAEAEVESWRRKEVGRGSCCADMEQLAIRADGERVKAERERDDLRDQPAGSVAVVKSLSEERDALRESLRKLMQWVDGHPRKATIVQDVIDEAHVLLGRIL